MIEVPKKELADMFGCATTTIDAYRKKGMPTVGEGRATRYNVQQCFKWLTAHTLRAERDKWDTTPTGLTEQEAKVRKLTAEALKAELELAKERRTVVAVNDSERELSRHLSQIRSHLLTFPTRTAPFAVMLPDEDSAREVLEAEIFKLMDMLANPTVEVIEDDAPEDEEAESEANDSLTEEADESSNG